MELIESYSDFNDSYKKEEEFSKNCDKYLSFYWQDCGLNFKINSDITNQQKGRDISITYPNFSKYRVIHIDTKHDRYWHTSNFFIEEKSCSIEGYEKLSPLLSEDTSINFIYYFFWKLVSDSLPKNKIESYELYSAFRLEFFSLKKWFIEYKDEFMLKYVKHNYKQVFNKTIGRLIPISELRRLGLAIDISKEVFKSVKLVNIILLNIL